MNALLGIIEHEHPVDAATKESLDPEAARIDQLLAERQSARAAKDFARADAIRDELTAMKVEIMDTPDGVKWKKMSAV
jgi:cysteinyl-tRNA synthetase